DGSVVEGNSETAIEFRIHTTYPRDFSYFVIYSTESVSATEGSDFTAVSGVVALDVETPSVMISVPVIGDLEFEPDEVFHVNLTADGEGFRIEDGQGVGTIVNDDPAPPPAPVPPPAPEPDGVPLPVPDPNDTLPPPPVSPSDSRIALSHPTGRFTVPDSFSERPGARPRTAADGVGPCGRRRDTGSPGRRARPVGRRVRLLL
ncbi:MAG: Calx-beta domain-containing protein, partial [Actinomycetota bacterium]